MFENLCNSSLSHWPGVLLFKNMKLLALRPTTVPTVLTNMDPLCVSAVHNCSQCYSQSD